MNAKSARVELSCRTGITYLNTEAQLSGVCLQRVACKATNGTCRDISALKLHILYTVYPINMAGPQGCTGTTDTCHIGSNSMRIMLSAACQHVFTVKTCTGGIMSAV